MNIRVKITVLFTLLVMAILSLLSLSIYYFSALERKSSFKTRLEARANGTVQLYLLFGDSSRQVLDRLDSSSQSFLPTKSITIYRNNGQLFYQNRYGNIRKPDIDSTYLNNLRSNGQLYSIIGGMDVFSRYYDYPGNHFIIIYAAYDEDGWRKMGQLKKILLFSLLGGGIITSLVGIIFSSQLVMPIKSIIREVNEISSHNLSHRIYAGEGQDELSSLAATFNNLLNRLQESFTIQQRFISNASHELSTPLTSISSQLQVTLQKQRGVAEYQQVMQSVQEDVEQMQQLTKSLLEIAKTGSEGGIELADVRIDEIIFKVVSDVKKINSDYAVELDFGEFPEEEKSCLTYGSADLLYSAIKNITENGCKYSPDRRSFISLQFNDNQIIVQIRNSGDIIAEEEIQHIFHPFYRATNARDTKGFGLGLALSKRIISLHKGKIQVSSNAPGGTVFTIELPSLNHYYPQQI
jgi:signal transduction histidine kinase